MDLLYTFFIWTIIKWLSLKSCKVLDISLFIGPLTPTIHGDKSGLRFWILCLWLAGSVCLFLANFLIYLYTQNIACGQ